MILRFLTELVPAFRTTNSPESVLDELNLENLKDFYP